MNSISFNAVLIFAAIGKYIPFPHNYVMDYCTKGGARRKHRSINSIHIKAHRKNLPFPFSFAYAFMIGLWEL